MFYANDRRSSRSVLYGSDLIKSCSVYEEHPPPAFPAPQHSRWAWVGRDSCVRAQKTCVSTAAPLRSAILSSIEQREAAGSLMKAYVLCFHGHGLILIKLFSISDVILSLCVTDSPAYFLLLWLLPLSCTQPIPRPRTAWHKSHSDGSCRKRRLRITQRSVVWRVPLWSASLMCICWRWIQVCLVAPNNF